MLSYNFASVNRETQRRARKREENYAQEKVLQMSKFLLAIAGNESKRIAKAECLIFSIMSETMLAYIYEQSYVCEYVGNWNKLGKLMWHEKGSKF